MLSSWPKDEMIVKETWTGGLTPISVCEESVASVSYGPNRWTHASTEGGSIAVGCFLSGTSVLLDHPVADVDRAGSLEHAHQLELRLAGLEAVEEPLPRAEDHRGHLEVDLVDQPGLDGLLGA